LFLWQQFYRIWKVEKSLILRAFRGVKSDLKFKFYEEQKKWCRVKRYYSEAINFLMDIG